MSIFTKLLIIQQKLTNHNKSQRTPCFRPTSRNAITEESGPPDFLLKPIKDRKISTGIKFSSETISWETIEFAILHLCLMPCQFQRTMHCSYQDTLEQTPGPTEAGYKYRQSSDWFLFSTRQINLFWYLKKFTNIIFCVNIHNFYVVLSTALWNENVLILEL